jgi:hypothetical protein
MNYPTCNIQIFADKDAMYKAIRDFELCYRGTVEEDIVFYKHGSRYVCYLSAPAGGVEKLGAVALQMSKSYLGSRIYVNWVENWEVKNDRKFMYEDGAETIVS